MVRLLLPLLLLLGQMASATPQTPTPTQVMLDPALTIPLPAGTAVVRATFAADAQVLGMTTYADGWKGQVSPVDLALGWGPMSDRAALDALNLRQGDRFYYWQIPASMREDWNATKVALHSTNIHIIPATDAIAQRLLTLRPGDRVRLQGTLVDVVDPNGLWWQTSLTRTDTGEGACEILLLSALDILPY